MSARRARKTSLFSHNLANIAYRDSLREEVRSYLEFLDQNNTETLKSNASAMESPKRGELPELSEERKAFLTSLPNLDEYSELMMEFLAKHAIFQEELDDIQKKLKSVPLRI